jgi:hypothetical protein
MSEPWWSIEVLDGEFSARLWREAHGAALIEAAITRGVVDWNWEIHPWGMVFEVSFREAGAWLAFRHLPAVTAALDAVPDPVRGLLIYPGRGGSSNSANPRRPRPHLGAGSAELPREPEPIVVAQLVEIVAEAQLEARLEARLTARLVEIR